MYGYIFAITGDTSLSSWFRNYGHEICYTELRGDISQFIGRLIERIARDVENDIGQIEFGSQDKMVARMSKEETISVMLQAIIEVVILHYSSQVSGPTSLYLQPRIPNLISAM